MRRIGPASQRPPASESTVLRTNYIPETQKPIQSLRTRPQRALPATPLPRVPPLLRGLCELCGEHYYNSTIVVVTMRPRINPVFPSRDLSVLPSPAPS